MLVLCCATLHAVLWSEALQLCDVLYCSALWGRGDWTLDIFVVQVERHRHRSELWESILLEHSASSQRNQTKKDQEGWWKPSLYHGLPEKHMAGLQEVQSYWELSASTVDASRYKQRDWVKWRELKRAGQWFKFNWMSVILDLLTYSYFLYSKNAMTRVATSLGPNHKWQTVTSAQKKQTGIYIKLTEQVWYLNKCVCTVAIDKFLVLPAQPGARDCSPLEWSENWWYCNMPHFTIM